MSEKIVLCDVTQSSAMADLVGFFFSSDAEVEGGWAGKVCRTRNVESGKARCGETVIDDVNER